MSKVEIGSVDLENQDPQQQSAISPGKRVLGRDDLCITLLHKGPPDSDGSLASRGFQIRESKFRELFAAKNPRLHSFGEIDGTSITAIYEAAYQSYVEIYPNETKLSKAAKQQEAEVFLSRAKQWLNKRDSYQGYANDPSTNVETLLIGPGTGEPSIALGASIAPGVFITASSRFSKSKSHELVGPWSSLIKCASENGKNPVIWVNCSNNNFFQTVMGEVKSLGNDSEDLDKGYRFNSLPNSILVTTKMWPQEREERVLDTASLGDAPLRFKNLGSRLFDMVRVCAAVLSLQKTRHPKSTICFQGGQDTTDATFMAALYVLMRKWRDEPSYNPSPKEMVSLFYSLAVKAGLCAGFPNLATFLLALEPNAGVVNDYLQQIAQKFDPKSVKRKSWGRKKEGEETPVLQSSALVALAPELTNDLFSENTPEVYHASLVLFKSMLFVANVQSDTYFDEAARNDDLSDKLRVQQKRLADLEDTLLRMKEFVKSVNAQSEKQVGHYQKLWGDLSQEYDRLTRDSQEREDALRLQVDEGNKQLRDTKALLASKEGSLSDLEKTLAELRFENRQLKSSLQQLERSRQDNLAQGVEDEIRSPNEGEEKTSADLEASRRENDNLKEEIANLQALLLCANQENSSNNTTTQRLNDQVSSLAGELARWQPSRGTQIALTVLFTLLFNVFAVVVGLVQLALSKKKDKDNWRFLFCAKKTDQNLLEPMLSTSDVNSV
jgi:hypothetical protein